MSLLVSRDAAGLRPARSTAAAIDPKSLTAHYGGPTVWGGRIGDHARCPSVWRAWQAWHMDGNGWADIAYSSAVCPHGVRFEGRGPGRRTAANGTNAGNAASLATVYLGGDDDPLTDAAKHGFLAEAARFGVPLNRVHSDWKSTSCPGQSLRAWVRSGCPAPRDGAPIAQPAPVLPPPIRPAAPAVALPLNEDDMKPTLIRCADETHRDHGMVFLVWGLFRIQVQEKDHATHLFLARGEQTECDGGIWDVFMNATVDVGAWPEVVWRVATMTGATT